VTAPVAHYAAGDLTSAFSQTAVANITVNKPANLANGDLLVVVVGFQSNSAAATPGAPAGFTRRGPVYNTSGDVNRRPCGIYTRPITNLASEAATYQFTTSNTTGRAAIVAFRVTGADLADPVDVASSAWFATSNSAAQARTLAGIVATAEALLLAFVWWQTNSATALSTTWTAPAIEVADIATNTGAATTHSVLTVAEDTVAAGATGDRTATLSGASTVANGNGYLVALAPAPAPAASDMRCIAHRGISSSQDETDEESVAGLTDLMAAYPWVNGVEVDARLSLDGTPWLMHDETFERVFPSAPNAATEGVEDCTDAELESIGVTRLDDFLEACLPYHFDTVMVQHYTAASEAALTAIVAACQASGMADRIMIMTSTSTTPSTAMASLRALGWTGDDRRIGMFGATAGTWSTYSAAAATNELHVAFAPPTAYDSNRTLAATLAAATPPVECGASTESDIFTLQHAETDGCLYALTDDPGNYAYSFVAPTNEPLPAAATTTTRRNFADSAFTIAPDFAI